jgi:uncharacterized protein YdeI (YjbR/CyaY-like superfamily)
MVISETLYVTSKKQWMAWLKKNHASEKEIWLIYPRKHSDKPRISYNDAVEGALCYGWIDSTMKVIDHDHSAQRFCPRRTKSILSELNKERIRRLIQTGEMTAAGLQKIEHHLDQDFKNGKNSKPFKDLIIPDDIIEALKADPFVWQNFQEFPDTYKTVRIQWINEVRFRPQEFQKRLKYFIKMTGKNKMYGFIQQYLD